MANLKKGTNENEGRMGIHLLNPTTRQVRLALKEANEKGIDNVYVRYIQRKVVRR